MGKGWSIFFGAVLLATFLLCVVAPFVNWWLPSNVASFGGEIDYLFYLILGFTAFFFVLTEAILVYNMYRFAYRPGHKSAPVYGNHRLELAWTIVPAAILLFIAFTQVQAWVNIKFQTRMPEPTQVVQVMGRQWDWTIRYAHDPVPKGGERRWAEVPEYDDFYVPEELHTWKGAKVKIYLKTQDVLHSFFMPNLRLKQDAVPGRTIPMWFEPTDFNARFEPKSGKTERTSGTKEWEIACAELCGSGHYRMRGHVYVYETEGEYRQWLEYRLKEASRRTLPKDEDEGKAKVE